MTTEPAAATTVEATTVEATIAETTVGQTTEPEPTVPTIAVVAGEPADGVVALKVKKGERIHFIVESDTAAEVHFHGYDVAIEAGPDTPAELDLEATIEGVFEVELEETGTLIARVSVAP